MNRGYKMSKKKNIFAGIISLATLISMSGCGEMAKITTDGMTRVGSYNVEQEVNYTDDSEEDVLQAEFSSDDGLCTIKKYKTYYDVTLDYEKGTPASVGAAYASTLLEARPDYAKSMEPYLYENIKTAFGGRDIIYESLEKRILTLESAIPDEYREEIESFANTLSEEEGYSENGKLSYIEILTLEMIPDALRPTACSALSLDGSRTVSGERLTLRNLEWNLGSAAQMTEIHAVTHMKKAEKSMTVISMLGLLDIITAVNDDGVMIAILDVGSKNNMEYVYEGKKCYTYEIRYALEEFDNARDAGEFLVEESGDFTWCNNLLCTDSKDALCCENVTSEVASAGRAHSVLRGTDTELMEGLKWDTPDALCIVNSFATKDNQDGFTELSNISRFEKYNKWVSEKDKFSVADMKGIMAHEVVNQYEVINVHNSGTVHTVIVDYATGDIHVAFTTGECADDIPTYLKVGSY